MCPYLSYCNLAWGSTYISHLKPLILLQKKAIRVLFRADHDAHAENLFCISKILKVTDLVKPEQAVYMYNSISNRYIRDHSHNTRNSSNLIPSYQRLSVTQHSLSYVAPTIWNSLPDFVKKSKDLVVFKRRMKKFLISN